MVISRCFSTACLYSLVPSGHYGHQSVFLHRLPVFFSPFGTLWSSVGGKHRLPVVLPFRGGYRRLFFNQDTGINRYDVVFIGEEGVDVHFFDFGGEAEEGRETDDDFGILPLVDAPLAACAL